MHKIMISKIKMSKLILKKYIDVFQKIYAIYKEDSYFMQYIMQLYFFEKQTFFCIQLIYLIILYKSIKYYNYQNWIVYKIFYIKKCQNKIFLSKLYILIFQ